MYLVFDTETTGLPKNWKAPLNDLNNWPRMVQIAWVLYDEQGIELEAANYIIKPNGFEIPYEAQRVHGISTVRALKEGVELNRALMEFTEAMKKAKYLVAHNISFDEKIVGAEFIRENIIFNNMGTIKKLCTKELSTNYCRIPGNYGYKWPNLSELYITLFKTGFEEAHNAETDVRACAKCFFELIKRKVIII
ncbi:3'-5' exonuclease [candidate division KSB1 bacterium]|nr:3'-5' exonuclease [candidate division KSB1 bacterium]